MPVACKPTMSVASLIVSKEVFHFEGKPYFVPIIASRTESSDATKTFMTSKTMTVA